jgi:D-alanyl-D-alanine dipeptidase
MKRLLTILLGTLLATLAVANTQPTTSLQKSKQLVLIITNGWNSTHGQLQTYERFNVKDAWKPTSAATPVVIDSNGLAWVTQPEQTPTGPIKKEGDMRTPAGIFPLGPTFGFGPSYIKKISMPYQEITANTVCVNDSQSHYYGRIIDTKKIAKPDWKSSDSMRQNPQNLWGIAVQTGSCSFLNIANKESTTNTDSVALPETEIENLITWLNPHKKALIVILPKTEYKKLQQAWDLPTA